MQRFSALAGGFALAILMLPTVTRTTEELLRLVPAALREAALASACPRWRTSVFVVLRTARPGIATGVMLAVARIAGETAPLLFTAFNNRFWSVAIDQPIASLPVQIFTYATSPYEDWHDQAWTGALVLITLVLFLNLHGAARRRRAASEAHADDDDSIRMPAAPPADADRRRRRSRVEKLNAWFGKFRAIKRHRSRHPGRSASPRSSAPPAAASRPSSAA